VVVNSVTRSGGNRLAGRAFGYFQDNKLMYRLLPQTERRGESRLRKQGGGSIGGPIVKNKLFFFGSGADRLAGGRQPELPSRGGAARSLVFVDDGVHRTEYVPATRLPPEQQQSGELPLDA
jgi:hypothetical protein